MAWGNSQRAQLEGTCLCSVAQRLGGLGETQPPCPHTWGLLLAFGEQREGLASGSGSHPQHNSPLPRRAGGPIPGAAEQCGKKAWQQCCGSGGLTSPIRSSLKSRVSLPGPTPDSTSPVTLLCKAAVPQFPHQLEGYNNNIS